MQRAWWVWPGPSSRKHRPDMTILITSLVLLVIGLVIQFAIGPAITQGLGDNVSRNYFFYRHSVSVVIGLVGMYIAWKIPLKTWVGISPYLFIFGIIMALLTIAIDGIASRWIQIGFFSFQPVEVLKLAFVLGGAAYIVDARRRPDYYKSWRPISLLIYALGVSTFIVVLLQRDLGSMAVVGFLVLTMLFVSGFSLRLFGIAILIASLLLTVFIASTPYRRDRFNTFLNPQSDCIDTGYHACRAILTVGSGGLFGRGVGKSVQANGYLPEVNNDSIFAVYAEILGFVGSIVLFSLYYKLFSTMYTVARRSELTLKLITVGVLGWFGLQTLINIGAMLGMLPLKGITLPFISYGGSSIMLVLFATGIILQISAYTVYGNETTRNNSTSRRRVRRSYYSTRSSS